MQRCGYFSPLWYFERRFIGLRNVFRSDLLWFQAWNPCDSSKHRAWKSAFTHSSGVNCLSLHFFRVYAVGVEISYTQNTHTHCPSTAVAFPPSLLPALSGLSPLMNDLVLSRPCQVGGSRAFFKSTSSSQLRWIPKALFLFIQQPRI